MQGAEPADAAVAAVWPRARVQLLERVVAIEDAVAALLAGELGGDELAAARREAHRLAGALGAFGAAAGSVIARELEEALSARPDPAQAPRLAERALALRRAVEGHAGGAEHRPELVVAGFSGVRAGALLRAAEAQGLRAAAVPAAPEDATGVLLLDGAMPDVADAVHRGAEAGAAVAVTVERDSDRVALVRAGAVRLLPASLAPEAIVRELGGLRGERRPAATILVVDDDPVTLEIARAALGGEPGRRVEACDDPAGFWPALEHAQPDLVVLDVQMPGIDGTELCRALRADPRWRAVPVLFLTSTSDPGGVAELFAAGGDDYVRKPVEPSELRLRVAGRLARARGAARDGVDPASGLERRGAAEPQLERLAALARRLRRPLTVGVLAVDGFASLDADTAEHALAAAGRAAVAALSPGDAAAAWGAGELVLGLIGADAHAAQAALDGALAAVRDGGPFSASAAVAELGRDGDDVTALVDAAARARRAAEAAGGDRAVLAGAPQGGVERVDVALVEDDEVLAQLVLDGLRGRGYRARWIVDGDEAARVLGGAAPTVRADLVLLDWDLPARDGPTVLRGLAADGVLDATRVVMLTARASQREILTTLELGATEHVAKPFSLAVLLQRVERVLGR